jgi:hypothetical protein
MKVQIQKNPWIRDDKLYQPGDIVDMTPDEYKWLSGQLPDTFKPVPDKAEEKAPK